ncbi:MAG: YheT family hydrolase [Polaromonas sp.]
MNYEAPWWLPGGNLQTIWAARRSRRYAGPPPVFRRERWRAPDSDFVDVDWLENDAPTLVTACTALPPEGAGLAWGGPARRPSAPTLGTDVSALPPEGAGLAGGGPALRPPTCEQPLLVVFHGLEGSSSSHYAQAFADVARSRGWACAVPHFRGCSGEINRAPRAYHAGDYAEIDWLLRRFARQHAGPVVAAGVSIGGNALIRWAAELGTEARQVVGGLAVVCSPLDLAASGRVIGQGFNRQVYTRMFLKTMVPKALQMLALHPGLFDRERLLAVRDLHEFDNVFTAPLHGFRDADDYWARASAKRYLRQVAVPTLALNALNDPFVPASSLPRATDVGRYVTLWQPAHGGHAGFPSSPPLWKNSPGHLRAMPEAITAFLAMQL